MPINLSDVKDLAEQKLVGQLHDRMRRLLDEKPEITQGLNEASTRLIAIDAELAQLEGRLKAIAGKLRVILNKIDPPGPPGGGPP